MSRIDDLITELCSDGVEYKQLSDLAITVPGLTGKTKADFSGGNARFASYRNIFANPSLDLDALDFVKVKEGERQNSVQLGDILITGSSESLDEVGMSSVVTSNPSEPIYLNSFCFIVRLNQNNLLDPGFAKHLFRSESIRKQIRGTASGVTRINISKPRFMKVRIPVPPLEVQREIVRILDTFSALEAELEAELEARKQQYEHYRSDLFAYSPESVPFKTFTEVGTFRRGGGPQKKDFINSGIGCIHYGQIYTHYGVSASATNKFVDDLVASKAKCADSGDVIIAVTSENDDDLARSVAWLGEGPVAVSNHTLIFKSEMDPRFISYYLRTRQFDIAKRKYISGTKVRSLPLRAFENIQIPVPSLQEQRRLADTLDKFDALVNDLSVGLPAELQARRQQYEYYRDKLLTFKELEVAA